MPASFSSFLCAALLIMLVPNDYRTLGVRAFLPSLAAIHMAVERASIFAGFDGGGSIFA